MKKKTASDKCVPLNVDHMRIALHALTIAAHYPFASGAKNVAEDQPEVTSIRKKIRKAAKLIKKTTSCNSSYADFDFSEAEKKILREIFSKVDGEFLQSPEDPTFLFHMGSLDAYESGKQAFGKIIQSDFPLI